MDDNQIRMLVMTTAQVAAKAAIVEAGLAKQEISKAEAYRRYGRRTIDAWVIQGKIVPVFRGSKTLLSTVQLEALARTNEFLSRLY